MNAFDFTIEVQDGSKVELSKFKGKVLVIVNTATGCGFTPQYSKIDVNGDNAIPFYKWITENTCSKVISMDIDGDIVKNIEFMGGCNGNLKTIPLLLDGWTVDQIEAKLSGIICGRRPTSYSDQLAKTVRAGYIASKDPDYKSPLDEE